MKDLPAPVMKAAQRQLPTVQFEDAWRNLDPKGKLLSYEVRGRGLNGKIREVRVSLTGEILEME
jgi:hypothetical protein